MRIFNPLYSSLFGCCLSIFYGFFIQKLFVDVVDAWFASYSGKDPYKIMKESTIGAIGALYVLFCFLKVGIITYVLYEKQYMLFLIVCIFQD